MKAYFCFRHVVLHYDFEKVISSILNLHLCYLNGCSFLAKEINRLRNEINRLSSKGMSNIYFKVTTGEKN